MTKAYAFKTDVTCSAEQLKSYWRFFGKQLFHNQQAQMLKNGYFTVATPSWRSICVYNTQAQRFIDHLPIADTPNLTFHVFGNGYMAVAKDNGFLDIYAPNGAFFATRQQRVRCFGQLSSYVYIKEGQAYLADITGQKEDFLLGLNADISYVGQNINGLVTVGCRNAVGLYNEKMERLTLVQGILAVDFFNSGSFIVHAKGQDGYRKDYLFNAQLKCLMESSEAMKAVDYDCFSICRTLYDSTDGSVINAEILHFSVLDGKPFYTAVGKLVAKDNQLLKENGEVVLGFFPNIRELKIFAGHFACFYVGTRFLVFDLALSVQETKQAISEVLDEYPKTKDIPQEVFDYFKQLLFYLEKMSEPFRKMLNGLLLS